MEQIISLANESGVYVKDFKETETKEWKIELLLEMEIVK